MSLSLRIILILASVLTLTYVLRKIRQSKMRIEYSVFWILLSFLFLIISIFPGIPATLSAMLGFQAPVNFIFLFIIFALIMKCFLNSIVISRLETKVEVLVRKMALDEALEREKGEIKDDHH